MRDFAHVFPVQIREDLVMRFSPVPFDLTKAEAERICRVIRALAQDAPNTNPGATNEG